jgi:hypothetical protein
MANAKVMIADKGYDSDEFGDGPKSSKDQSLHPIKPSRSNRNLLDQSALTPVRMP